MNTYFLPKTFDLDIHAPYCCTRQHGESQTTPHWHSGAEIIFMVKGSAAVWFNNAWHELHENAMLFVPRGQLHCCRCTDPHAEKIVMGFTEKCFEKNGVKVSLPAEIHSHCVFHDLKNTPLPALLNNFDAHCQSKAPYKEHLLATAALFQIYAYLLTFWEEHGIAINNTERDTVGDAIHTYIETHFAEDLSPYTVAKQLNISYSSLSQKMKVLTDESFIKCVNRTRVEHAKKLLAVTEKSVTEICFECGFSSTSYFIKVFRELTTMTPHVYRKRVNNEKV